MESILQKIKIGQSFNLFYITNFLVFFHLYIIAYINSSFLTDFISDKYVGTVYIAGSLAGVCALFYISRIIARFGNYAVLIAFTIAEIFSLIALAFFQNAYAVIAIFIAHLAIFPLILFSIDIFIESRLKSEENTGSIRGTLLTIANMSVVLSPLIVGFILTNGDFWKIYLISASLLLLFLIIAAAWLKGFADPAYHKFSFRNAFEQLSLNRNVYGIFMSSFLMRLFFAFMVVYMPIYLHDYIGFDWSAIGVMFTIMLLPYVLFEIPAGKLADKSLGEKEMMFGGFLILAVFTSSISFIAPASFILWTAVLFMTRVGASLVEVTTESYFFKHVKGDDADTISLFRMTRPAAYIIGPIAATVALLFIDLQYLFLLLGIILFSSLYYTSIIRDTK